jgi:hypothetical protein
VQFGCITLSQWLQIGWDVQMGCRWNAVTELNANCSSKMESVLNAMFNGTNVLWDAEWNGYLNGSLR